MVTLGDYKTFESPQVLCPTLRARLPASPEPFVSTPRVQVKV